MGRDEAARGGWKQATLQGRKVNDLGRGRLWLAVLTVLDVEAEY